MTCPIAQGDTQKKNIFFIFAEYVRGCTQLCGISLLSPAIPRETEGSFFFKPTQWGSLPFMDNLTGNLSSVFSQIPHCSFETSIVLGGGLAAEWSKVGLDHPHR